MFAGGLAIVLSPLVELASANAGAAAVVTSERVAVPLARGPTGRVGAASLTEQLAIEQAMADPAAGNVLTNIKLGDPRWPASDGWVKMSLNINGVEVHYVRNVNTGAVDDFQFKNPPQ